MPPARLRYALLPLLLQLANVAAASEERRLEEVVVIAQRVEESAQSTPVSLVSFNAEQLETLGISGIADIRAQAPNFQADPFPTSNQTLRLFIRGVGIADVQLTQDPAVGVYLDGVYLARSTGLASDVADLARIEVLRGPQGTLYGRNTTGGALNLVSRRPSPEELELIVELGTGNRDRLRGRGVMNLPLGGGHAVKLAALHDELQGFVKNAGPGGSFGDRRARAYRVDYRWQAGDLAVDYAWDRSEIESYNYTPQAVVPGIPSGTPADAAVRSSVRFVPFGSSRFSQLATTAPLLPGDTEIDGHSLTLSLDGDKRSFKSITAWRDLEELSYIEFASGASSEYRVDFNDILIGAGSSAPRHYEPVRTRIGQRQFSQELQLFGALGPRWDYVAGLYYFQESATEDWFPMHHIFSFPVLETNDLATAVNIRAEANDIENRAWAAYGQFSWNPAIVDSRLFFTVGLRYSRDHREVDRVFRQENYLDYGPLVLGPLETIDFAASGQRDFDDVSTTLMVEYEWTDDFHAYGKYVEAYKSGGFNTRDPAPEFFRRGFDEEKNRTVELGFKGELLHNSLRVNGNVFYADFSDLQLNFQLPGTISDTRVFNSGSATLSGFEMELVSTPLYGLVCSLNYAYLDSEIDDVIDPFTGERRSFSFPSAPRNTASLNVDYRLPLPGPGQWSVNVNYNHVDDRETSNPRLFRAAYQLLNGRLTLSGLALAGGQVTIATWIKNALNEEYVAFAVDNLPHASRAVLWGEPRTWGLDLRYDY